MVDFGRDCLWVPQLGIDRRSVGTLTLTLTKLALGPRARFCLEHRGFAHDPTHTRKHESAARERLVSKVRVCGSAGECVLYVRAVLKGTLKWHDNNDRNRDCLWDTRRLG